MGLFDGVPAPTYVEPGEDRRRAGLFGLQMSEPFNRAFQQSFNRERQFQLEAPERKAQMERWKAAIDIDKEQLEIEKLKREQLVLGANLAKQQTAKQVEALQFEATLGGNYSPENWGKVNGWVAKNPEMASTPWFKSLEERFDTAAQFRARGELASQQATARGQLATDKAQADANKAETEAIVKAVGEGKDPVQVAVGIRDAKAAAEAPVFRDEEQALKYADKNPGKPIIFEQESIDPETKAPVITRKLTTPTRGWTEVQAIRAKAAAEEVAKKNATEAEKAARKKKRWEWLKENIGGAPSGESGQGF